MTEIQLTKLQLANFVCDELHKEMPFDLIFNQDEFVPFMEIIDASNLDVGFGFCSLEDGLSFHTDQLKQLVKSHELVASWGGLADAKVAVKVSRHKKYLKRAIADVESCMEVKSDS